MHDSHAYNCKRLTTKQRSVYLLNYDQGKAVVQGNDHLVIPRPQPQRLHVVLSCRPTSWRYESVYETRNGTGERARERTVGERMRLEAGRSERCVTTAGLKGRRVSSFSFQCIAWHTERPTYETRGRSMLVPKLVFWEKQRYA